MGWRAGSAFARMPRYSERESVGADRRRHSYRYTGSTLCLQRLWQDVRSTVSSCLSLVGKGEVDCAQFRTQALVTLGVKRSLEATHQRRADSIFL